ncbi:hypothetical protein J057_21650 [Marinobacter nanhaiticus D15-8W]|uniref:Uncharacterized protein n=1 Tax=Marinobacter nanhaiticus D15-8W TaxID=626887 RepID=N6WSM5_9GAMM|nr:hypothetical protein [Marinobacter nanhaiticus]ENO14042.1 hypothetical protein J057_21650 [Marinobacter nanhaiticus D15-8W]
MPKLRVVAFSVLFFGVAFSAVSLVFYFGDWQRLALVGSAGVFVGLVAAPTIEPKAFKHAWAYELLFGALAGAILGLVSGAGPQAAGLGALLGGVLGYLAPYWIKHVPIP